MQKDVYKSCAYCDVKETETHAGSKLLWGKDLTSEYPGKFNIVRSKYDKKYYLQYVDDESDNTSEAICFCLMCGRKLSD